ncbi:hypothetical protein ACHAWU_002986 [Discostella pseudostelligera]|uniref:SAC3/GANP/THP3 conserved domain-containing protein n=1 Tax=Discostella pseudostelligera TaxID=259834 RepID=A0ABD3M2U7_9STRA
MYYHHWTELAHQAKNSTGNAAAASSSSSKVEAERREKWANYYAANSAALAHYHLALSKGGESSVGGAASTSASRPESPPMPPQMMMMMMTNTAAAAPSAVAATPSAVAGSSGGAAALAQTEAGRASYATAVKMNMGENNNTTTTTTTATTTTTTASALTFTSFPTTIAATATTTNAIAHSHKKKKKSRWAKLLEEDDKGDDGEATTNTTDHGNHSLNYSQGKSSANNSYSSNIDHNAYYYLGMGTVGLPSTMTTTATTTADRGVGGASSAGRGDSGVGGGGGDTTYYLDRFVHEQNTAVAMKRKYNDMDSSSVHSTNKDDNSNYYGLPTSSSFNDNDNTESSNYYGPASSFHDNEQSAEEEEEYVPLALDRPLGYKTSTTTTTTTTTTPGLSKKERKRQKKLLLLASSSFSSTNSPSNSYSSAASTPSSSFHHHYDLNGFNASETTLSHRALRFQGKGGLSSAANAPTTIANVEKYMGKTTIGGGAKKSLDEADYERMTVKGTCRILEKEYLRLTSPPKAELVRPQSILEQHLSNLKSSYYGILSTTASTAQQLSPPQQPERKIHNGKARDYHWYCSQFKAIRQDLTVQRIQNAFAVDVYETHAKIALEEEDMNEYNQSQTQNECIHHALLVRAAVADSNYHQFFQLQDMAPNMGNYLMDKLIPSVRQGALQRICKAYRPSVSVSFVLQELGFDIKRKKEVKGAMTWMTNCGCIFEDGMLLTKDTTLKVGESVGGKNSLI